MRKTSTKKEVVYIPGRRPREILTILDTDSGDVLERIVTPLRVLFHLRDVVQIIVGASLLAIPLSFTEEVWNLGETLPVFNIVALAGLAFVFISLFTYYNVYQHHLKNHYYEFVARVIVTYIISALVVALFMTLIDRAPWATDLSLALKRVCVVLLPASMSAVIADMVK